MKAINYTILMLIAIVLSTVSCKEIEQEIYDNNDGRFVRFHLQVNSDGVPVNNNQINPSMDVVSKLNLKSKKRLAVPVSLTSEPLQKEVRVKFSTKVIGNYADFVVEPNDELVFNGAELNDTIFIRFNKRWNEKEDNRIVLKLENVTDADIHLGMPNQKEQFNQLEINLKEINLLYFLQADNIIEIKGEKGESYSFDVVFPKGFFNNDFNAKKLLNIDEANFAYALEVVKIDIENDKISYKIVVKENIDNDNYAYFLKLSLNTIENYTIVGKNTFKLIKPERINRDVSLNTAAYFYNLTDPYYRTYGVTWMDFNNDGICKWTKYNAFTYPVIVDADNPNAVLYDDKGTTDPSDDIYHHAFRIGFKSPIQGKTTNSFNLKRFFTNESTDADASPGFNISQALEFYPENGNNSDKGLIKILNQELTISDRNDKSYKISIDGEGEYNLIENGVYRLSFILKVTNKELFGGTLEVPYLLFNIKDFQKPEKINSSCFVPIEL